MRQAGVMDQRLSQIELAPDRVVDIAWGGADEGPVFVYHHGPPTCRHETPIGDYCQYCAETPEG